MPVDPKGTAPGLTPDPAAAEKPKTVFMKCKKCDSIDAVPFQIPGHDGQRMYRCVKCHTTVGVNVGGAFNL